MGTASADPNTTSLTRLGAPLTNYLPEIADQLGAYDLALFSWLRCISFDYGSANTPRVEPLRVVKASPERAFAEVAEVYELGSYEEAQVQIPLPICSFVRTDVIPDKSRFNVGKFPASFNHPLHLRYLRPEKDELYQNIRPLPYNFSYQIDFWARYSATIDQIRIWLAQRVRYLTYFYLPVDFTKSVSRLIGPQLVYTSYSGLTDTSELEPGADVRVERVTTTLDVQGWLFYPFETAKTVRDGVIDFEITIDGATTTETQRVSG